MLKIREYNKITGKKIDLKELEKFGFRKSDICFKYEYDYTILTIVDYQIQIYPDRKINIVQNCMYQVNDILLDKIYDLTEAGYVEKVKEE